MGGLTWTNDPTGAARGAAMAAGAALGSKEAAGATAATLGAFLTAAGGVERSGVVSLNSLKTPGELAAVPHGSLVHVRGMVQDMLSPEYFPAVYRGVSGEERSGMWADTLPEEPADSAAHDGCPAIPGTGPALRKGPVMAERKPLIVVGIPGETSWRKESYWKNVKTAGGAAGMRDGVMAKRTREDEEGMDLDEGEGVHPTTTTGAHNQENIQPGSLESGKRPRCRADDAAAAAVAGGAAPAAASPGFGGPSNMYIVKVYDTVEQPADSIRLNAAIDFVGVLTRSPELTLFPGDVDDEIAEEMEAAHPPSSQVPRVHCMWWRPSPVHIPPSLTAVPEAQVLAAANATLGRASELRARVLHILGARAGLDPVAAEYVLLTMLSRVHTRSDDLLLGNLSLNLLGCDPPKMPRSEHFCDASKALCGVLTDLLPQLQSMSVSLQTLNSQKLVPFKDYNSNRLVSTPLQVGDGTLFVLDETSLTSGQLNATGTTNVGLLKGMIERQQLIYDFQYYQLPMNVDIPVIICSKTKSLLSPNLVLPVRSTSGNEQNQNVALHPEELEALRSYLCFARSSEAAIAPDDSATSEQIQADIVAARAEDKSLSADTFHLWMTLSRYIAVSHGHNTISLEHWRAMRNLERLRNERLRVV